MRAISQEISMAGTERDQTNRIYSNADHVEKVGYPMIRLGGLRHKDLLKDYSVKRSTSSTRPVAGKRKEKREKEKRLSSACCLVVCL